MITKLDIERFTCGDCHYLARAINLLTGWPIHCFNAGDGPDMHAFCIRPDGCIIDVKGVNDPGDFAEHWMGHRNSPHSPYDFETIREAFGTPAYGRYTYRRAKKVARELVA